MAEKPTMMKLKVDLQCYKCYKKVKKVLCKFPQIQDQVYNEKENIVTIKVVCCDPEKIRDKLCYKGGSSIKSIEILVPKKEEEKKKEDKKEEGKKKEDKKEDAKDKEKEKPKQNPNPKPKTATDEPPMQDAAPQPPQPQPAAKFPEPAPGLVFTCPPPPTAVGWPYNSYYGRPIYDSYGGGGPSYVSHYDQSFNEENTSGCIII